MRLAFLRSALAIVLLALLTPALSAQGTESRAVDAAKKFVGQLIEEDFNGAASGFDSTMTAAMPAATLEETWRSILLQVGDVQEQGGTRTEAHGQYQIVFVRVEFAFTALDIRVAYDSEMKVAGLLFQPAKAEVEWSPASYADSSAYSTQEFTFGAEGWKLPGTLYIPAAGDRHPAVILVHGSGPNDRDETVEAVKPFRDLATGLASRGILVMTYDKRTLVYGERFAADETYTLNEETVEDALLAIEFITARPDVDPNRVFVIGHSLGGMAAPRIASRTDKLAGLVMLAGAARPLEDILLEQLTFQDSLATANGGNSPIDLALITGQIAQVKSSELTDSTPTTSLPLGVCASYWLDLRGYEPASVAIGCGIPMLILQGESDLQVSMIDFGIWKDKLADREDVTCKSYPTLGHLFTVNGSDTSIHVEEVVIADVADWISAH